VKDENGITLEYFNLRTNVSVAISTREQLPEDGQVWPKRVAI
jgi:hypothetical protein